MCEVFIVLGTPFSIVVDMSRTSTWSREVLLAPNGDIALCTQRVGNVQKGWLQWQLVVVILMECAYGYALAIVGMCVCVVCPVAMPEGVACPCTYSCNTIFQRGVAGFPKTDSCTPYIIRQRRSR